MYSEVLIQWKQGQKGKASFSRPLGLKEKPCPLSKFATRNGCAFQSFVFRARETKKRKEKMLLLRKKLYISELINFQYFLVDVRKSFIMFNELTQILWHIRLV